MRYDRASEPAAVIVTRPEPDATAFAAALLRNGLRPVLSPVLTIRRCEAPVLEPGAVVAFTSANGARSVAPPPLGRAFAVGDATAYAAREQGWPEVIAADGDVAALAETIAAAHRQRPFKAPIIHIAGSHRAGDLVAALQTMGVRAERRVAYEAAAAASISAEAEALLSSASEDVVATFFSARSAALFMEHVSAQNLVAALRKADAVCLSAAVAAALSEGAWRMVAIAARPDTAAMIAAISNLAARRRP